MSFLSTLSVNLTANVSPFTAGLRSASGSVSTFAAQVRGAGGGIITGLAKIGLAAQGVRTIFGTLTNVLGKPLSLAADAEQTAVAFEVLLGSVGEAEKMMKSLQQFAATTPFQFPELADASKKLIAFGFSGEKVVPTLKSLGDLSAGLNIPIGELSEIYGKARVQGRLFMEDINQLSGRGIPIQTELARLFGVTGEEVRKLVSSGQVNFGHLEQAFQDLTAEGGKFAGLMGRQSETLAGKWSTFKDEVSMSLLEVGKAIAENLDLKNVLTNAGAWLKDMTSIFKVFASNWAETWEILKLSAISVLQEIVTYTKLAIGGAANWIADKFEAAFMSVEFQAKYGGIEFGQEAFLGEIDALNAEIEQLSQANANQGPDQTGERGRRAQEILARLEQIERESNDMHAMFDRGSELFNRGLDFRGFAEESKAAGADARAEMQRRMDALTGSFMASNGMQGGGSMAREAAAAAERSGVGQSKAPGLLEAGSVEAFRAMSKFSQPETKKVAEEQLAVLRDIRDDLREPPGQIEFA